MTPLTRHSAFVLRPVKEQTHISLESAFQRADVTRYLLLAG
jgi:hypothetical protein